MAHRAVWEFQQDTHELLDVVRRDQIIAGLGHDKVGFAKPEGPLDVGDRAHVAAIATHPDGSVRWQRISRPRLSVPSSDPLSITVTDTAGQVCARMLSIVGPIVCSLL